MLRFSRIKEEHLHHFGLFFEIFHPIEIVNGKRCFVRTKEWIIEPENDLIDRVVEHRNIRNLIIKFLHLLNLKSISG